MSLVNKLTRALRWLRWSTICAILFYVFFIGLILHSTTYKLQHTLKARQVETAAAGSSPEYPQSAAIAAVAATAQKHSSSVTRSNVLHAPGDDTLFSANILPALSSSSSSSASSYSSSHSSSISSSSSALSSSNVASGKTNRIAVKSGGTEKGIGTVTGTQQQKQQKQQQQQQQRQQHFAEPETVIIAASSVNEKQILEKALRRADKNKDNQLTIPEMAVYINKRILEHIDEAIDMNPREFRRVDISPADGLITWEEYHRFFLKSHGMTDEDIDEHNEIKHTALNRKAREDMMRDKARWAEAARTDLFSLTIDEYLSFRHPESSVSNLLELVDDLLRQFDQDGDDQLTIEEFSQVDMDDDADLMRKSLISKTVVERREEFRRIIDKNHDGKADRGELLYYVNPRTPRYALQEAATIFSLCDENHDGKLSLDEMAANAEIILTSKMIDTANSFHTEF